MTLCETAAPAAVESLHGLPPSEIEGHWHVAHICAGLCSLNVETRYVRELERREIGYYLPREKVRSVKDGVKRVRLRPAFSRVCFVALRNDNEWYAARVKYASYGIKLERVTDERRLMSDLEPFWWAESNGQLVAANPKFVKDARVRVVAGHAFEGKEGHIDRINPSTGVVTVPITWLGASRSVEIEADFLEIIAEAM